MSYPRGLKGQCRAIPSTPYLASDTCKKKTTPLPPNKNLKNDTQNLHVSLLVCLVAFYMQMYTKFVSHVRKYVVRNSSTFSTYTIPMPHFF